MYPWPSIAIAPCGKDDLLILSALFSGRVPWTLGAPSGDIINDCRSTFAGALRVVLITSLQLGDSPSRPILLASTSDARPSRPAPSTGAAFSAIRTPAPEEIGPGNEFRTSELDVSLALLVFATINPVSQARRLLLVTLCTMLIKLSLGPCDTGGVETPSSGPRFSLTALRWDPLAAGVQGVITLTPTEPLLPLNPVLIPAGAVSLFRTDAYLPTPAPSLLIVSDVKDCFLDGWRATLGATVTFVAGEMTTGAESMSSIPVKWSKVDVSSALSLSFLSLHNAIPGVRSFGNVLFWLLNSSRNRVSLRRGAWGTDKTIP